MKKIYLLLPLIFILVGCAPKMGEDIIIEPQGNIRLESSKADIALELLSVIGLRTSSNGIRLGSDVKIINHWMYDITLRSLSYTLSDSREEFAYGEVILDGKKPMVIASNSEQNIPITLLVEPAKISIGRIEKILASKEPLYIRGVATIQVWGISHSYAFDKEISKYIAKALNERIPHRL
ncbi:MAG: hypothetical protein WA099_10430 [Sulfuricurvum sp.]